FVLELLDLLLFFVFWCVLVLCVVGLFWGVAFYMLGDLLFHDFVCFGFGVVVVVCGVLGVVGDLVLVVFLVLVFGCVFVCWVAVWWGGGLCGVVVGVLVGWFWLFIFCLSQFTTTSFHLPPSMRTSSPLWSMWVR
ncbi:hypothetical protein, partial [Pseudomonas syringae group genomosp. 7]|uniref:hypothetical protein n=1 Tax=Pseudomonas syringae group genomosp. 7 TaxID=251699 RepID=UPI00376FB775